MKATILATISLSALLGACTTTTYYHPPRAHMTYDSHAIGSTPTTETKKETKTTSSKEVKDVSEKVVTIENSTKNTAPFCVTIKKGQGLAGNGVSSAQAYAAAYVYNVPKLKNGEPNFKVGDTFCINKDGAVPKKEKK